MVDHDRAMLTIAETAAELGISKNTLYDLLRRRAINLSAHRLGRQLRVSRVNLDRYLAEQSEAVAS
jgi:excisionase family DNA binding protein